MAPKVKVNGYRRNELFACLCWGSFVFARRGGVQTKIYRISVSLGAKTQPLGDGLDTKLVLWPANCVVQFLGDLHCFFRAI